MTAPDDLHRAFQDAFNRHDLDSIVVLYASDAVLVGPQGPVHGIAAILEWYRQALAARPVIDLQTLSVHVAGNLAMLHGRWTVVESGPNGAETRRQGRSMETARQQPDGRWLFVIDIPSLPT